MYCVMNAVYGRIFSTYIKHLIFETQFIAIFMTAPQEYNMLLQIEVRRLLEESCLHLRLYYYGLHYLTVRARARVTTMASDVVVATAAYLALI